MSSHRAQSAANVIRTLAGHLAREVPPDIAQIVSITKVEVSPDLMHATVYVTALTNVKDAIKWLMHHSKRQLKPRIAKDLNLFAVPSLRFVHDEQPEKADRLEQLLK